MSHSLRDGKTRGLLDGLTDWAIGDVSRRLLKATQQWYLHPLHVPVILLNIAFDHAAWEVNRMCIEVGHFEFLSRDAEIESLEMFDTITTELQYIRRDLGFLQSLTKFLLETMEFLEKKVFDREIMDGSGGRGRQDDFIAESYRTYVYQTNPHMEEKLNNIVHLIENNLATCEYLQSRTRDSLDFVSGFLLILGSPSTPLCKRRLSYLCLQIKGKISLRDNASNREDADSNKTMSFLQMVFLPATFVAAIVSMNFFDLTASPPTVSGYIWIFVVVALLLTGFVLGLYFFWKWRSQVKIDQEEKEAKRRERMGAAWQAWEGVYVGEDGSGSGDDKGGRKKRRRRRKSRRRGSDDEESPGDTEGGRGPRKRNEKPELTG